MKKFNNTDVYDKVTTKIIDSLTRALAAQKAGKKWKCPWVQTPGSQPISIDGHRYRGMNYVWLSMMSALYPSQLFGTYDAWKKRGAQVRYGEKNIPVFFWKTIETIDKDTGEKKKIWFVRCYPVFAAEQVDGFNIEAYQKEKLAKLPDVAERIENADNAFNAYCEAEKLDVKYGGNRAFYSPDRDMVQMPLKKAFKSTVDFYSTLAHELGHSTGHEKRLNRDFKNRFGSEAYAFEELVAELTASMTCAILGLESTPREDHADYIAHWLLVMKEDNRAIFTAASQAQRASDMILKSLAVEETEDEELDEAA